MKTNAQTVKFGYAWICVSILATLSFNARASTVFTTPITLDGTAQGGTLSLTELVPIYGGFVSIVTTQGESAEVVLHRLAGEVGRSDRFSGHQPRPQFVKVAGNTLTLPSAGLRFGFSGTDKGLVSLKPVLSVSGSYDREKHQVRVSWINPPEQYDAIVVGGPSGYSFPPNTTNWVYACDPSERDHMASGLVVGKRGNTLSPPASIIINKDSQEELDTYPFYMGLAPNWSWWSDGPMADACKCEQGIKANVDMNVRGDPSDKPLYQIVRTTQSGVQGGVWRRFLDLKPGNTYKIEVRLNTLLMDACTNTWAFSFHAAHDNPDGTGLSVPQMAGRVALPNGSKGAKAGCGALYEPGVTTKGKWVKRSTNQPGPGLEIKNITLPTDVTSITVWLRHSGENSSGVGMDWIRVEDVTSSP